MDNIKWELCKTLGFTESDGLQKLVITVDCKGITMTAHLLPDKEKLFDGVASIVSQYELKPNKVE